MSMAPIIGAGIAFRPRITVCARLCLLLTFLLASALTGLAQETPARGEAKIAVIADLTQPAAADQITISLKGRKDRQALADIVRALGSAVHAQPAGIEYTQSDPALVDTNALGISCRLPFVPRGDGYLPIEPFVQALAAHAKRLRIIYVVVGPFTYQGYQQYENADVSFTVEPPQVGPSSSNTPLAFYSMNVIIKNPALKNVSLPHYPAQRQQSGDPGRSRLWAILTIAALLGIALGTYLSLLLARWKTTANQDARQAPTRGHDD